MPEVTVTIAEPCHENWQNMTRNDQGRFCSSCKKDVVDFSIMSDAQLFSTLLKGDANMCGRFSNIQMEKGIKYAVAKKNYWHKYFIGFLFPAFLYTKQASAQMGLIAISKDVKIQSKDCKKIPVLPAKGFEFSGRILDAATNELIGSGIITIKGTGKEILIDERGSFTVNSNTKHSSVTISIEASGYELKEIEIAIPANHFIVKEETIYLRRKIIPLENVTVRSNTANHMYGIAGGISSRITINRITDLPVKIKTALTDSLRIYPNPVSRGNEMQVALKLKSPGNYTMQILDLSGKIIFQQTVNAINKRQVSKVQCDNSWSSGMYMMRILGPDVALVSVARFVVK
ncbi:MAG: T9SS type A sorting domain-containing protein [Ferruginibacter sp.]